MFALVGVFFVRLIVCLCACAPAPLRICVSCVLFACANVFPGSTCNKSVMGPFDLSDLSLVIGLHSHAASAWVPLEIWVLLELCRSGTQK